MIRKVEKNPAASGVPYGSCDDNEEQGQDCFRNALMLMFTRGILVMAKRHNSLNTRSKSFYDHMRSSLL